MKINSITKLEWDVAKYALRAELSTIPTNPKISELLEQAISDFDKGLWGYDGATFVTERFRSHIWEVPSFIHDWRNSNGFVGKQVDNELFNIMHHLNYPKKMIRNRRFLCNFVFLNVLRHKILGNYKRTNVSSLFLA